MAGDLREDGTISGVFKVDPTPNPSPVASLWRILAKLVLQVIWMSIDLLIGIVGNRGGCQPACRSSCSWCCGLGMLCLPCLSDCLRGIYRNNNSGIKTK